MKNSDMDDVREIMHCEVCNSATLETVLNLGSQPLPDDLIPIGDLHECRKFPVEILYCSRCRTAHQRFQVDKKLLFPPAYHYRAAQTNDVLDGMEQFVDSVEKIVPHCYGHVLDVGCNDGSLLDVFKRRGAMKTCGIEPTDAGDEAAKKGHGIDRAFLDAREAQLYYKTYGHPDLITFTNVFAHIEDLKSLIAALFEIKKQTTWIVIENHYLGSVLERHQFDTFYQEHPRTYSLTSFEWIANALGMHIAHAEFPKRYGGNIRVFLAPDTHPGSIRNLTVAESSFGPSLLKLQEDVERWQYRKRKEILALAPMNAVAMPARASVLINALGLYSNEIIAVFEKEGSKKIGYYVPGTRIPILSDMAQHVMYDKALLNLAWHIPDEIEARWRALGFTGKMIQAVTPEDFT